MLSRLLGRRQDHGPDGGQLAVAEADAALRQRALHAIASHPELQILTIDGLSWLDPFSGQAVPAPFGHVDPAVERLVELRPWERKLQTKSMAELQRLRWVLHLRAHGDDEPRLRMMARDGRWLNPFDGRLHALPEGVQGPAKLVEAIAAILAATTEAAKGPAAMKPKAELDAIIDHAASRRPASGSGTITRRSSSASGQHETAAPASSGDSDIDKAKQLMEGILPRPPQLPGYEIGIHYEPHAHLGGDFFDFIEHGEGRWLALLADVSGHGVQGALAAVAALKSLRLLARFHPDLADLLTVWNDEVRKDLPKGHFISAHVIELDPAAHAARVFCCGAHPILRLNAASVCPIERIGQNGPALGILPASAFAAALRPCDCTLAEGDALVAYTDGLSEASEARRGEYGHHRVMGSVLMHSADGCNPMLDGVVADLRGFCRRPIDDDLSIMRLGRRQPA